MTATRITVSRAISINFWMSESRLILEHSFCGNSFISSDAVSSTTFQVAVFL